MADLRELTTRLIDEVWNAAFDDGKVVAVWSVNELFTVLKQLGVEVTPPDRTIRRGRSYRLEALSRSIKEGRRASPAVRGLP